jgi:hypothetical protein
MSKYFSQIQKNKIVGVDAGDLRNNNEEYDRYCSILVSLFLEMKMNGESSFEISDNRSKKELKTAVECFKRDLCIKGYYLSQKYEEPNAYSDGAYVFKFKNLY